MTNQATATFITQHHLFEATINTGNYRLQEVMHNSISDYLNLQNVTIYRLTKDDAYSRAASFPTAILNKAEIHLVLVKSETHEAPEKRMYSYVPKRSYSAFTTACGYDIQGHLSVAANPDPVGFLAREAKVFFPITRATLIHVSGGMEPMQVGVVLVRKAAVTFLQITNPN